MKRKICSIVLAVAMAASMLMGCGEQGAAGGNSGTNGENGAGNEAQNETPNAPGENGEMEKVVVYVPSTGPSGDLDMVTEELNKLCREKIQAEVEIQVFDFGQFFQQYALFISGTEEVDLLPNYSGFSGTVAQGAALDITDLIQEYGQDILALEGDFIKCGQQGGVQYAIPIYSTYSRTVGILYREDIVRELGLEEQVAAVKTLEDWTPILEQVKANEPNMTPYVTMSGSRDSNFLNGTWDSLSNNYGVLMNGGKTSEVVNLYETEEYANLCNTMREWYLAGYTNKDIQTQTDDFSTLARNDAAFSAVGPVDFSAATFQSTTIGKDIGVIPLSDYFARTYDSLTFTIMSNSKHPEAAMKFFNLWFSDPEVADLIAYGIEGVHYQINEEGKATYLEGQDLTTCTYHIGNSINNSIGVRWDTEEADFGDKLIDSNNNSPRSVATGFCFDAAAVTNEITQLDNICSKYRIGLECGALDPAEYLSVFNEELKSNGLEKVIEEKQKQLNTWLEENNQN